MGARWNQAEGILDLTGAGAAIIPVSPNDPVDEDKPLVIGELYCGGFSGWTHAIHELILRHMNIVHGFALDKDSACCDVYEKTHAPNVRASDSMEYGRACAAHHQFGDKPSVLLQTTITDVWWMTCIGRYFPELLCLSPPCPAWSLADASPGLGRNDGFLLLQTLVYIAFLRPKIFTSENVANMKHHKHFKVVLKVIEWANYRVHWSICLDLKEIIPQHGDRFLLIASDKNDISIARVQPIRWPVVQMHSLRTYQVIMPLDELWSQIAAVSQEEFDLYMDPKNMPREFGSQHAKRLAKKDVVQYRLKNLDQTFACILTTYGRPASISSMLIRRGWNLRVLAPGWGHSSKAHTS